MNRTLTATITALVATCAVARFALASAASKSCAAISPWVAIAVARSSFCLFSAAVARALSKDALAEESCAEAWSTFACNCAVSISAKICPAFT